MNRTIVIGLDGATFTVLDQMMEEGVMPRLQKFLAAGVRADLMSTVHPLTPPAWTTLVTGKHPANHGIFDFFSHKLHSDGFFLSLNHFHNIRSETLWTLVSRQGGKVLSLNYPLASPPPAVDGIIVPGLLSWRHLRRNVHPPSAYEEFASLDGFDVKDLSWDLENEKKALQDLPDEELESWVEFHIRRERLWLKLTEHALRTDEYDLAAVVFDGVDKLQHGCWRLLDPKFRSAEPSAFETRLRNLCLDYFRLIDESIERIVSLAGPEARVFIVSDHGFGPSERVFRINKWLEQNGYLKWRRAEDGSLPLGPQASSQLFAPLDWNHTTAYVPSPASNGIYIRVQSEPMGCGVPPAEYEEFRAKLRDELLALTDPITGEPLLKDVLTREEAFPGALSHEAPDLTLVLCDHGFVSILDLEPAICPRRAVIGTHYPAGVLAAIGPGIRAGETLVPENIVDVAPTLLYSLGLSVPDDFEGHVMQSLFEDRHLESHPIGMQEVAVEREINAHSQLSGDDFDAEGDAEVIDRLRALGYVE